MTDVATAIGRLLDVCGQADWKVGAATGIHPNTISRLRTGQRKPTGAQTVALCKFLEVSERELLGEAKDLPYERTIRVAEVDGPNLLPAGVDDPSEWID